MAAEEPTIRADDRRWAKAGLTYRRLDHWSTRGYLRTFNSKNPGTGCVRRWPVSELAVAARMVELIGLGFTVDAAHRLARDAQKRDAVAQVLTGAVAS